MDWNAVSAVAGVVGAALTLVSILVATSERKRHASARTEPVAEPVVRTGAAKEATSPYTPFLYVSVGLVGACGGVASIYVPWVLLEASPSLQFILYPLLVLGVIGGVALALLMDYGFRMDKVASPWLRFSLSATCGLVGGWLGLLVVIGVIIGLFAGLFILAALTDRRVQPISRN